MRILYKLFLYLFLIIVLALTSGVFAAYYYQDDIEQVVIQKINNSLESSVKISKVEISIIKNFPFASIELIDVVAIDRFQNDTLLKSENITLKFNALDIYNKNYQIQEIDLRNGFASVYFKNKIGNYEIWKTEKDSATNDSTQFGIESIKLNAFGITYQQKSIAVDLFSESSELNLIISDNQLELKLNGKFVSKNLNINEEQYLTKEDPFNVDAIYSLKDNIQKITGQLNLAEETFNVDFSRINSSNLLKVTTSAAEINNLFSITPKKYLKSLNNKQINGITNASLFLEKETNKSPLINVDFKLRNLTFKGNIPIAIENGNIDCFYSNGKNRNIKSSSIVINNISCLINGEKVVGNGTISNFENLHVKTNLNSKIELSNLIKYGVELESEILSGTATFNIDYNGKVGAKSDFKYDLSLAKKEATLRLKNINYKQKKTTAEVKDGTVELRLSNDLLVIDSLRCSIGKQNKFEYDGAIENVFGYFLLKNETLKIGGDLHSDWIFLDELLSPDTTNSSKKAIELPSDIIANINTTITDFTFDRFHMRNFKSKLSYNDKLLKLKGTELETMSGKITSEISFEQVEDGKLRLISTSKMDQINARQLFYEFRNFGQTTMRHTHLRGKITSDIYLRNEWDKYFNPILENLYGFIDLKINDGQLIEFEPMMLMSDYISVNELKKIKFSTLENQIEIKNKKVEIPFMEIHSSAIDIAGSGTHSFENDINYEFKILLNEIISGKLKRKKNKKEVSVFEEVIQDDGIKGVVMFLKMEGTIQEPIISHNTIRLRSSLKEGLKNEKKELKEILKNEFDGNKETENERYIENPDYDNIIEWEN